MTTLNDPSQVSDPPPRRSSSTLDYWLRKLANAPSTIDLATDQAHTGDETMSSVAVLIADGTAQRVGETARREGTTRYVVLLAAWKVLLAQLSGQRDLIVGGWLVAGAGPRIPLRTELDGSPQMSEVIGRVDTTVREAIDFEPTPETMAELGRAGLDEDDPRLQASFDLVSADGPDPSSSTRPEDGSHLSLDLVESGDDIAGTVRYRSDRFTDGTARRLAAMFEVLTERLLDGPDQAVFEVSPLPVTERDRILHRMYPYNPPVVEYTTMAQPFEEQVSRTPDAIAVIGEDGELTYRALNTRANQLAWRLREAGARPGTFVAVSMHPGIDLMVALYAVAKSGAAYVPIDPELPEGRGTYMLEDAVPVAVLVDDRTRGRIPAGTWRTMAIGADADEWATQPTDDLPALDGNHLVHMLYTSGTTGRPKAVAYPVDGALADTFWFHAAYPYGPGDTALFKTSYGFDVSIWEIFWPLYFGARVVVAGPEVHRDPARLRDIIETYEVTMMFMVPSMTQPFYDCTVPGSCPSLRWVLCGGEAVTPHVRDGFHERFSGQIINAFGPTELGCVAETVLPVEPEAPVPIGRPPTHRRIYILDDNMEPTPIGVPGELFVGGEVGMAQSYHRQPGLTAERFVADPFGPASSRMYRTGDVCRIRSDGTLAHLGRVGRQVKVRGVRIELAEIEAVLAEHHDVGQCVVTVIPDRGGEIAAVVTAKAGHELSVHAVAAHARELLPRNVVPRTVTVVETIPKFVNGKIDFERLLGLIDHSSVAAEEPYVEPATDTEAAVAAIFGQILGADEVSATAHFFDIGGHSALVFDLMEMCTDRFDVDLGVRSVLQALTPRGLAELIEAQPADVAVE